MHTLRLNVARLALRTLRASLAHSFVSMLARGAKGRGRGAGMVDLLAR